MVLTMLSAATACRLGNQVTAFSLLSGAVSKTAKLDAADMSFSMKTKTTFDGVTTDVSLSGDVLATGMQSDNPTSSMNMTMSAMGMSFTVPIYQENGYVYFTLLGQNVKAKAEDATEYDVLPTVGSLLPTFTKAMLDGVEVQKNKDGSGTVSLTPNAEEFSALYADLVSKTVDSADYGVTAEGITFRDAKVEVTVAANGYVSACHVAFTADMKPGDEVAVTSEVSTTVEVTVQYRDPGPNTRVTITPPEGYAAYEELDGDSFLA